MNVNLHLQHKTHSREIPITSRNKVLDKSVDASCGYPLLDVNATKIIACEQALCLGKKNSKEREGKGGESL